MKFFSQFLVILLLVIINNISVASNNSTDSKLKGIWKTKEKVGNKEYIKYLVITPSSNGFKMSEHKGPGDANKLSILTINDKVRPCTLDIINENSKSPPPDFLYHYKGIIKRKGSALTICYSTSPQEVVPSNFKTESPFIICEKYNLVTKNVEAFLVQAKSDQLGSAFQHNPTNNSLSRKDRKEYNREIKLTQKKCLTILTSALYYHYPKYAK